MAKILQVSKKEVNSIYYRTLNKFINEFYDKEDYSLVEDIEATNDTVVCYKVSKRELDMFEQTTLHKFVNKSIIGYTLPTLLLDLCNKGVIEEGNYLIEIYW